MLCRNALAFLTVVPSNGIGTLLRRKPLVCLQMKNFSNKTRSLRPTIFHRRFSRTCINIQVPGSSSAVGSIAGVEATPIGAKKILKFMMSYIWPKGKPQVKRRVLLSLSLLAGAKLLNVQVPFLFKHAVDSLSPVTMASPEIAAFTTVSFLIMGYGMARVSASLLNEMRDAVFAKVAQRSIRDIARNLFSHLHSLDMRFHMGRQTGALSKAIDRGTKGINFVFRALVFNIVPTIFEVTLVSSILVWLVARYVCIVPCHCVI